MTRQRSTSAYTSKSSKKVTGRRTVSMTCLVLTALFAMLTVLMPQGAMARDRQKTTEQRDTTAFLRGFAVSVDLVGPIQMMTGDYGQYEAALRINLKDRYFPTFETGIGKADHTNEITQISYKTTAPYFKIGADFNILKNKHDIYRLFVGARYAFTSFKYDLSAPDVSDPVWQGNAPYSASNVNCSYHWMEALIGVDAKMWGPVHLGWSLRYRGRLAYNDGRLGKSWYVPGYGKTGSSNLGGTFNVTIDI